MPTESNPGQISPPPESYSQRNKNSSDVSGAPPIHSETLFEICTFLQNSLPADDFRTINHSDHTCLINDNTIDMWRQKLSERNNSNSVK